MEKLSLPFFYKLGSELKPVIEFEYESAKRLDLIVLGIKLEERIDELFKKFTALNVCKQSGTDLVKAIDSALDWYRHTKTEDRDKESWEADSLFQPIIENAKIFEAILIAELDNLAIYHVTQKGIYSISSLIDNAENAIPLPYLAKLEPLAVQEVRASGRCLAFDNHTASGFHIIRAAEVVLHQYFLYSCKPTSNAKLANWG